LRNGDKWLARQATWDDPLGGAEPVAPNDVLVDGIDLLSTFIASVNVA
jgi:hypothetical protein